MDGVELRNQWVVAEYPDIARFNTGYVENKEISAVCRSN